MLLSLAILLLSGAICGSLVKKIHFPELTGMILAGILLGPYVFNLLDPSLLAISSDLRELALVILLLQAGLSLDLSDVKQIGLPAVLMGFVPAIFEMAATILIAPKLFGIPVLDAAILAAILATASPAVVVPRMIFLIQKKYGTEKKIPQLLLASDSFDDVFNLVIFTVLVGVAHEQNVAVQSFVEIPIKIIVDCFIAIAMGGSCRKFFNYFLYVMLLK